MLPISSVKGKIQFSSQANLEHSLINYQIPCFITLSSSLPPANKVERRKYFQSSIHRGSPTWGPGPSPSVHGPSRPNPLYRTLPPQTYSNLFNLDLIVQTPPPPPEMFKLVHCEACTLCKWAFH